MSAVLACAMALALVTNVSAQEVKQLKAKVIRVSGHARFTTGNNVWQPLKVGDTLRAGTVIQTENQKGSFVDLVIGDGSGAVVTSSGSSSSSAAPPTPAKNSYQPKAEQNVVRIMENSALGIDKLTSMDTGSDSVTETQLDLKAGHIMGSVKKLSAASKYEVKIPNGVAGIRGSLYELWATGLLKVGVGLGVLAWVGGDGNVNSKDVSGGNQFDPATGEVSPISPSDLNEMNNFFGSFRGMGGGVPNINDAPDHTIYHVSPIHGNGNGNGGNGGNSNGLLQKIVSKSGSDSSSLVFGYNSSQKLITLNTLEVSGGTTSFSNETVERNSQGIIQKLIIKNDQYQQSGLDSVETIIEYNSGRYISKVTSVDLGGGVFFRDSVSLIYDGSGKVVTERTYDDIGTGSYDEMKKIEYTYSGNNIASINFYSYDGSSYSLQETFTYDEYDNKISPMSLGNEAFVFDSPAMYSSNNPTKSSITALGNTQTYSISYTYNASNYPLTALSTIQPGNSTATGTYYYQ